MGTISAIEQRYTPQTSAFQNTRRLPQEPTPTKDKLELNTITGTKNSMQVVLDRAMEKLRGVVNDARAALGLPDDAVVDTSPEATANRIADFAIGSFSAWQKNHKDLPEDEARKQFASFIGGAIQQGISEARGILQGLNALSPEVDSNIETTWNVVQDRLNKFVSGE